MLQAEGMAGVKSMRREHVVGRLRGKRRWDVNREQSEARVERYGGDVEVPGDLQTVEGSWLFFWVKWKL